MLVILRRMIKLERTRSVSVGFLLAAVEHRFFLALRPTKVLSSLTISTNVYIHIFIGESCQIDQTVKV